MGSSWINLDGPTHYVEHPGPADGPTFVLVHGLGGSHVNWMMIGPALASRGRVLALDLAGFGKTPLGSRTASITDNLALLDRFIHEVAGVPPILVGNSMGGLLSIMHAHRAPEHTSGIVLVCPALPRPRVAGIDRAVATAFAAYMVPIVGEAFINRRLRRMGPERLVRETLELVMADPSRIAPELLDAQIAMATDRATMPWAPRAVLQAARSMVRLIARKERVYRMIREVSAPALLIQGRQDRLVPVAAADAVAAMRPSWEHVTLDDVGHVPMMEAPSRTIAAIEAWLDGPAALLLRPLSRAGEDPDAHPQNA